MSWVGCEAVGQVWQVQASKKNAVKQNGLRLAPADKEPRGGSCEGRAATHTTSLCWFCVCSCDSCVRAEVSEQLKIVQLSQESC